MAAPSTLNDLPPKELRRALSALSWQFGGPRSIAILYANGLPPVPKLGPNFEFKANPNGAWLVKEGAFERFVS
jgi:hypothetical protein